MKTTLLAILCIAATLLCAHRAHAGAWTQPEGSLYTKAWARSLRGGSGYFADGKSRGLGRRFQDLNLQLYAEYGLTQNWTLVASSTPLGHARFGREEAWYTGTQQIGARRAILRGPLVMAVEAHVGTSHLGPARGQDRLNPGEVEGKPFHYRPVFPTHQADAELQLGYGGSWGWATCNLGLRGYTSQELDPAAYGFVQVGKSTSFGLVASAYLTAQVPFGDVTITNVSGTGQTRYAGYGVSLSWWFLDNLGVNIDYSSVLRVASNAAASPLSIGIEGKFETSGVDK